MPKQNYHVFAYRFSEKATGNIAQLWSIGWENQMSHLYNWKGKKRKEQHMYVFQYTISGVGMIELDGKEYKLSPGKAFFINISDEYRYYLPDESKNWEFLFITLYGDSVKACWEWITTNYHAILRLPLDSKPIQHLVSIYQLASEKGINNAFHASSLTYQFIMELYQYSKNMSDIPLPENIWKATLYAQHHFHEPIGPNEMADVANLSRYHFTRMFKKATGLTPIQYLSNLRIVKGAELLYQSKNSIEEIAHQVGYANANYFTKVFRRSLGMTPGEFRKKNIVPNKDLLL